MKPHGAFVNKLACHWPAGAAANCGGLGSFDVDTNCNAIAKLRQHGQGRHGSRTCSCTGIVCVQICARSRDAQIRQTFQDD